MFVQWKSRCLFSFYGYVFNWGNKLIYMCNICPTQWKLDVLINKKSICQALSVCPGTIQRTSGIIMIKHCNKCHETFFIITSFHSRKMIYIEISILPKFTAYKQWTLYLNPGTLSLVLILKFICCGKEIQSFFIGINKIIEGEKGSKRTRTSAIVTGCKDTHSYLSKIWEVC